VLFRGPTVGSSVKHDEGRDSGACGEVLGPAVHVPLVVERDLEVDYKGLMCAADVVVVSDDEFPGAVAWSSLPTTLASGVCL
jgi:hypothetical protein